MKNNQLITVLSVKLCDLCVSVLKKLIFNTETTKNTEYHREKMSFFEN